MASGQMAMDLRRRERPGEQAATGETYSRLVWRRFRRHRLAVIGGSAAVFLSLVAVLAPWLAPYRPEQISLADRWRVPSRTHPFGTDRRMSTTRINTLYLIMAALLPGGG